MELLVKRALVDWWFVRGGNCGHYILTLDYVNVVSAKFTASHWLFTGNKIAVHWCISFFLSF